MLYQDSLLILFKLSFETVVLKGLAADGGLFLPHKVPIADNWVSPQGSNTSFNAELILNAETFISSPSKILAGIKR